MSKARVARVFLVGCFIVSILVSLAPPGVTKEERSSHCPRFDPVEPKSASQEAAEAPDAEVLTIRDSATENDPLVLELDFEAAFWAFNPADPNGASFPVVEDTQFFNLQVITGRSEVALTGKLAWDDPWQVKDFDEFLYDSRGKEVAAGIDGLNCCPLNGPEELVTFLTKNCDGFTLEARAYRTVPTSATLEIWLRGS